MLPYWLKQANMLAISKEAKLVHKNMKSTHMNPQN
jgi:hypothetical protein